MSTTNSIRKFFRIYTRNGPKRRIDALRPVLIMSRIIGVIPIDTNSAVVSRIYGMCVMFILCYFYGRSVFAKASKRLFEPSVAFMDALHDGMMVMFILWTVFRVNIYKYKQYVKFHTSFKNMDRYFQPLNTQSDASRAFMYLDIIGWHLIYFVVLWHDVYIWSSFQGLAYYGPYMFRQVIYYFLIISVMLLRQYAVCIRYRFELLGDALQHIENSLFEKLMGIRVQNQRHYGKAVKIMHKVYTKTSGLIATYNEVFGWVVVMMFLVACTSILLALKILLVYRSGEVLLLGHGLGSGIFVMCTVTMALPIMLVRSIYSACLTATHAAHAIPLITHEANYNISYHRRDELKDSLARLALESSTTNPRFWSAQLSVLHFITEPIVFLGSCFYLIVVMKEMCYESPDKK